ncbi:MAG: hypothetical protein IPG17_30865 [Sandaracinaceae bacterium]|nr:hypothetical protein [Sandaracinaceae bacterium]MBP7683519.1 hypothetical protein [Deltaproteobacteria bacterium]MBK6809791.1 hypothetical protein [Sandaracinaceae bacterium]MBK7155784.1 hypothetical protein [Sandaracinaceae bacterium]MBK8410382.1 hypothetical protein [Sandaracinaceae bacterium]
MEARCNALIFVGILATLASLQNAEPASDLDQRNPGTATLASLEDAFATDPGNRALARRLAETYLDLERPGLAVAVLRSGDPSIMEDPIIAHRMSQAYEATGRVLDAYATARYAQERCVTTLRNEAEGPLVEGAEPVCSRSQLAVLDVHARVLQTLVAWGVSDPLRDPRTTRAYEAQMRVTSVALAGGAR